MSRLVPAVAIMFLGCVPPDMADPGFTVRDSAGVTIVESRDPAWQEGERWRISANPLRRLAGTPGPPTHPFCSPASRRTFIGFRRSAPPGRNAPAPPYAEETRAHLRLDVPRPSA